MANRLLVPAAALLLATVMSGCGGGESQQGPAGAPPPAEVGVFKLSAESVKLSTDLPARTAAFRVADVRPQVNGVILKRLFTEGEEVKAGEPLYQIDPAPFQAALSSAQAAQAKAEANVTVARSTIERYRPLAEANAVSKLEVDNALATLQSAEADVQSAKAQVETARINLTYTKVLSPIAGRTGRSSVTEGALVTANQADALVVVQQLDPIYVDATQPSVTLLNLRRQLASGEIKRAGDDAAEAKLTLEDGSAYAATGKLQFSEVTVDATTGSVTLRALFPNPDRLLLPGMFVHAQIEEGERSGAVLVPQQAVVRDARGQATTMVVGADNKVQPRMLKTERAIGADWLVSDGVKAGERVIVQGIMKARPGATVAPKELTRQDLMPGAKPAAQPAAAAH